MADTALASPKKFADPDVTAKGERRARVALGGLRTLWINTGSLCNITCRNCYIDSSPDNDRLAYITRAEAAAYLDEIEHGAMARARDRLHRRRAVHESGHHRHAGRRARARLPGAAPDQRHAADAAAAHPSGPDAPQRRRMAAISSFASASITTRESCMTPSGPPGPSPRPSKGSTGSRVKALRWRWPVAPAGARASRPRATVMPR